MIIEADLGAGARNLLIGCGDARADDRVLIVQEDPDLGWYDLEAASAVEREAKALGAQVRRFNVGGPANASDPALTAAIDDYNLIIFFARMGDQNRFSRLPEGKTVVMSYARDAESLASPYGRANHRAFVQLKQAVNETLQSAKKIDITCPLGTALSGMPSANQNAEDDDVSVRRFPLGVPQPTRASGFSGTVALARYLTSTGSKAYSPSWLPLDKITMADVRSGRVTGYRGDAREVEKISAHAQMVATRFGIERDVIHSWHAGIHPGCTYSADIASNPDRWSNNVFTHPRFLHFHVCGNYPPGEISWLLAYHSVAVDGTKLWEDGQIHPERFELTARCVEDWPELAGLCDAPSEMLGAE